MSSDVNEQKDSASSFASVSLLKTAHADLLKRYREELDGSTAPDDEKQSLLALLPDITEFLARGRITGRLIDDEDERAASQAYLDYWVTVIYRAGLTRDHNAHYDATLADFDPDLAPAITEDLCPFLGLDAFQEQNASIFYGRSKLVSELLAKLRSERLLAVVGPSGSGKSSVVLAGLLPELRAGALSGSEAWNYYAPMVPSANPLRSLALAVRPAGQPAEWVDRQIELFKQDTSHLRKLFEQAASVPSLLVVDQFEEAFTLCHDDELRQCFVDNLVAVLTTTTTPHRVLITMRIEYQERMPGLDVLYDMFQKGLIQVLPLSVTDLRDAIEKPAANVNLRLEKGIVDSLVKEIVGEPAGLPLLQFTLLELWKRRRRNRVLLEDYKRLGGARRALTNVATAVYDQLSVAEQSVAKRIFLRLAWTDANPEVLRNRVTRSLIQKSGGSSDQVDAVLRKLVAARLIRLTRDEFAVGDKESPNDQFEVAHEALIRNWQLLVDWLQAEHDTLRQRLRLRATAEQWASAKKDPGGLLGGSLLQDAAKYTDLNDLEVEFIAASQAAEELAKRNREEAELRERHQLVAIAEQKTRAAKLWRVFVGLLAAGLLITGASAYYAFAQKAQAEAQKAQAEAQKAQAEASAEKARTSAKEAADAAVTASKLKMEAEKNEDAAKSQRKIAEQKEKEANKQRNLAEMLKVRAQTSEGWAKRENELYKKAIADLQVLIVDLDTVNRELQAKDLQVKDLTNDLQNAVKAPTGRPGTLKLRLKDVYGNIINDKATVTLRNQFNQTDVLQVKDFPTAGGIIEGLDSFAPYQMEISPSSHRDVRRFVKIDPSGVTELSMTVVIDPRKVRSVDFPAFTKLSPEAQLLLTNSREVLGFEGKHGAALYDSLDDLRRAGLLNILSKARATTLSGGRNVSQFIKEIKDLRGDRFLVSVDKELRHDVRNSVTQGSLKEVPSSLHQPRMGFARAGSFKTTDRYGSLQITFFVKDDEYIADIDIDEQGGVGHALDVLGSYTSGRNTHPYDIHELLVFYQNIDPGYHFVP